MRKFPNEKIKTHAQNVKKNNETLTQKTEYIISFWLGSGWDDLRNVKIVKFFVCIFYIFQQKKKEKDRSAYHGKENKNLPLSQYRNRMPYKDWRRCIDITRAVKDW